MPRANNSGGKRQGSGRKAGSVAALALANRASTETVQNCAELGLSAQQIKAAAMVECGEAKVDISSLLDISRNTLLNWRHSDWWPQARAAARKWLADNARQVDESLIGLAVAAVRDTLQDKTQPKLRLDAGEFILDRTHGKALVRQASSSHHEFKIEVISHIAKTDAVIEGEVIEVTE